MGASASGMKAADQPAAESLLTAFKTLSAAERRRHASVLNYWLSVRGDKEFPPLHDLDPLELSDAGPSSVLLELISGGHDAEIRHLGEALREEAWPERIIDAPNPSVLSCIAKKLPIVAISRDFLAFEDEYETAAGKTRCSVTLLPLSAGGAWVDYVYALASVEAASEGTKPGDGPKKAETALNDIIAEGEDLRAPEEPEAIAVDVHLAQEQFAEDCSTDAHDDSEDEEAVEQPVEPVSDTPENAVDEPSDLPPDEHETPLPSKAAPGFSKLLDSLAGLTGFYGSQPVRVEALVDTPASEFDEEPAISLAEEPVLNEAAAEETTADETGAAAPLAPTAQESPVDAPGEQTSCGELAEEPAEHRGSTVSEGSLENRLTEVRAKADEARMARLRANEALHEGLSAAYDFALDAEEAPEEYLRLVEAQGLKIQLRSPMKPVVKLAFSGTCDELTIKQLEAVLAWAFEQELPRGTLAERIEAAGGIAPLLNPDARAA